MVREEDYNEQLRVLNTYINVDLDDIENEYDREVAIQTLKDMRGGCNVWTIR